MADDASDAPSASVEEAAAAPVDDVAPQADSPAPEATADAAGAPASAPAKGPRSPSSRPMSAGSKRGPGLAKSTSMRGAKAAGSSDSKKDSVEKYIKEGWLEKSDPKGKNWKKRFMVVDNAKQKMAYYQNDPKRTLVTIQITEEPKGILELAGGKVEAVAAPSGAPTKFCFKLGVSGRDGFFCAKDQETLDGWIAAIQEAIDSQPKVKARRRWALLARELAKAKAAQEALSVAKEGWVMKTEKTGRSWTTRYLALDPATFSLSYFEDDKKTSLKGVVSVANAELHIGLDDIALRALPIFRIATVERSYDFCVESWDELQSWINTINATINAFDRHIRDVVGASNLSIPYEGYLLKSNPVGKYWKKRWISLNMNSKQVAYYTNETRAEEKGNFMLDPSCTVAVSTKKVKCPTPFNFVISTPTRQWYFSAATHTELSEWVARIQYALRKQEAQTPQARYSSTKFGALITQLGIGSRKANGTAAAGRGRGAAALRTAAASARQISAGADGAGVLRAAAAAPPKPPPSPNTAALAPPLPEA